MTSAAPNQVSNDEILTEGAENVSDGMEFEGDIEQSEERVKGARVTQTNTKGNLDLAKMVKNSPRNLTMIKGNSETDVKYGSVVSATKQFNLGSATRSDGVNGPPQSRAFGGSTE